ncbi:MAG TPA: M14/M99 family metallopeptidase [Desulfomonilaceae bacterium]|nr:M14/M99 family metallopeptidase [Desulfomonilaceae bacterium]
MWIIFALILNALSPCVSASETVHQVYFKGTDSELDVYTVTGAVPGPTLLLLGGIQGDEPGGYLAADLYADISLKQGNLIVVPRANFFSIVENNRGVQGDMNRKFAGSPKSADRDTAVVALIKDLMTKSDYFLNLHDGSGFYANKWESPERNPLRYGQSIICDAEDHTLPDGKVIRMGRIVNRVLERVNAQLSNPNHLFRFNNHRTLSDDTKHKEQRLSATFHALTKVGIPAFGIETSKSVVDYRLRVRYQTMVVNAFLEEFGIVPENPKISLENPYLRYAIISINGRTPIVVNGNDVLKVHEGDNIRIVHIESNYSRGLTARIQGQGKSFNDLNLEVTVTENTSIQVRKDRFLIGTIPVELIRGNLTSLSGIHFEPQVKYFCVRVNDKTFAMQPGDELQVSRGDTVVILDPQTNLSAEDEKAMKIDLRGFQAESSPYPLDDRGHHINTATDLQEKYGRTRGSSVVFALQAKMNSRVFAESYITVVEPRLEYLVLKESGGGSFVVYPGDKLELPENAIVKIMDVKTNIPEYPALSFTMSGRTVRWQQTGSAGIDASKLSDTETPLDIIRKDRSLGRIWVKRGREFRLSGEDRESRYIPVRYER